MGWKHLREEALTLYLQGLKDEPRFSKEDQLELARKMEAGDGEAREMLIKSYLRFVVHVAKKFRHRATELTFFDLIQAGNLGLVYAVDKFDWTWNVKVGTYAEYWIRQYIQIALSKQREGLASLDTLLEGGEDSLGSLVRDSRAVAPARNMEATLMSRVVEKMLDTLDPIDKEIVAWSFGLRDGSLHKTKGVAKILNLPAERVRQRRKRALYELKRKNKDPRK